MTRQEAASHHTVVGGGPGPGGRGGGSVLPTFLSFCLKIKMKKKLNKNEEENKIAYKY